ncbi:MAG: hypothetical protein HQ541_15570, partial [Mariniphaga sp.]|nr:hypothetical protein [Mariniphaga sp.]
MNKLGNLFAYYYSRYICYFINKTFFFFLINVILITKTQAQNHAPEFTSNPITTVNDTEIYRYPISASDFDGDVIEVTAPVLPEWLALTNYWVSTFAGSGIGYLDGAGVSAKFDGPSSVAIDKSGNLYVTELNNHRIRKISTDGNVTTLAGSGVAGYLDGIGIDAQFNKPGGIAVDGDGNIYVSERANHTIRKILPDGTVSTLAGSGFPGYKDSIGTNSEFSSPRGIDVDVLGNIYVSDYNNNVIRKITPDGIVSTLAGSGMLGFEDGVADTAEFRYPTDVTVDDQGHIFVCDSRNHVIREITIEGMVLTAAGTGESGFIDGAQNVAEFRFPYGIAVDGSGNLYVADGFNESVRKINSDGYTSTLAGKMSPGYKDGTGIEAKFNGVGPLALDSLGNIFMTDFNNHRIRKIESYPLLYGIALGNAGTHPVQLKVTDSQEAYSLQEFIITVNDIIPPEALCISDTVLYLNENGNANIDALGIDNGSNDASGIASLIIDSSSFNYENIGSPLLVTLTATDNFSNESTCTTTVIVLETIPESAPEFISTPVTTVIDTQNYNYNISAFDTNGNPFLISA